MAEYRFQVMNQSNKGLCGSLSVETAEVFGVVRKLHWSFHGTGGPGAATGTGYASPSGSMLIMQTATGEEWARLLHCAPHEMRCGLSYTIQSAVGQDVATLLEGSAQPTYRFAA